MAWVEDWNNFGALYLYRPFLNELRVAMAERLLTVDPTDPTSTGTAKKKTMATDIGQLVDPANMDVAGQGVQNFYDNFQDLMTDQFYDGGLYLQYWTDTTWETLASTRLPRIDEATMLTRIGDGARLAAPNALDSDTVLPWMIQQYKMLNELRWFAAAPAINQNKPLANLRRGFSNQTSFATADTNADAEYAAGTLTFDNQNGWPEQFVYAIYGFYHSTKHAVTYETLINNMRVVVPDAYNCDLDAYFYAYAEGPDGFDAFGTGLLLNQLHLSHQDTAVGGFGGYGTSNYDILYAPNTDFTGRYTPGVPTLGNPTGVGWTFDSGPAGQEDTIVLKFNVTGGFTKIT
jgi:hypothetical protein